MSNKVIWQSFPKNKKPTEFFFEIVTIFEKNIDKISSDKKELSSNDVLSVISKDLLEKGYQVELSKK
jgi:hypothetical protein